jgi:nucleotide-binding universal stress UspA family protein
MFQKIVVCLDRSELGEQVLPYASDQARKSGGKLVLLHICKKDFASFDNPASGQFNSAPVELVMKEFSLRWHHATVYLERIADRLSENGIDAEPVVIEGDGTIADSICAYADEGDVDLIVMASSGRTGLRRLILGSIAGSVARRAGVPVLVVKPGSGKAVPQPLAGLPEEIRELEDRAGSDWNVELDPSSSAV